MGINSFRYKFSFCLVNSIPLAKINSTTNVVKIRNEGMKMKNTNMDKKKEDMKNNPLCPNNALYNL